MMKSVVKRKISRSNTIISNKRITRQQTQPNPISQSSIPMRKKSKSKQQPTSNGKPIRLPALVKKTLPIVIKPISSAPIQVQSSLPRLPPSIVVDQVQPLKLTMMPSRLPPIKDYIIKENLIQKATLKCKSPRPMSTASRSTTLVLSASPDLAKNVHPLQSMDVGSLLSESARLRLKRLFKKLDTDKDGHLTYTQVQRCIPLNLPRAQLTFLHVLYDVISCSTFFGLQEFFAMAVIVEIVAKQDSTLWKIYLDDVDFNYYHDSIFALVEDYNDQCSTNFGTISYGNLLELIQKRTVHVKTERIANELEYVMPKIQTMKINRLDFIALLPAIIHIQSSADHGQTLFRFRQNSLLDLHMRQALLI